MVIVRISELVALDRVELHCEDVVRVVAVVGAVEEADVLAGESGREAGGGSHDEGDPVAAQSWDLGVYGEDEARGEGRDGGVW